MFENVHFAKYIYFKFVAVRMIRWKSCRTKIVRSVLPAKLHVFETISLIFRRRCIHTMNFQNISISWETIRWTHWELHCTVIELWRFKTNFDILFTIKYYVNSLSGCAVIQIKRVDHFAPDSVIIFFTTIYNLLTCKPFDINIKWIFALQPPWTTGCELL